MTQGASTIPRWHTVPWLAAVALVPVAMLLQHWDPCDSTAAIAAGSSMLHIGVCLVIGALTGLALALDPASQQRFVSARQRWKRNALILVCFLLVLWLATATAAVYSRGNLRYAVNGFWQWTSMLVWSISIAALATRPGFVRLAITGMLSVGVGVLLYGYWEYGVIQPALRQELERNPVELFRRQGIAAESSAALLLADRIRSTEMKGIYALANSLGGFLAGMWILVLSLGVSKKTTSTPSTRSPLWQGLVIASLGAIAIGLLLTKSRTAWIAAAMGSLVLGLQIAKVRGRIPGSTLALGAILVSIVLAGLGLLVYLFDPLILQEAGKSLAYRLDYWRGASELIARAPWLGYGVGGFQSTYLHVKLPTAAESPADPHNFLLESAHAGGIPYLLLSVLAIGLALWLAFSKSSEERDDGDDNATSRSTTIAFWSGAMAAVCGLLVWSLFTDSDEKLLGTLAALGVSAASAACLSGWSAARTSVQALVHHSEVLGIVLMVNLVHGLASGGWLLPGTMGMGLLGIGLALGGIGQDARCSGSDMVARRPVGLLVCGSVLLATWYGTMALPVSKGLEQTGLVFSGLSANPSPQQIRQLMVVDRWDPDLARLGMEWVADHLARPMGKDSRTEWETVLRDQQQELVRRDPANALAWDACGQASVRAAASTGVPERRKHWLQEADRAFERASELSPASAQSHLQAALSARWVDDWPRSLEHCRESETIDQITPHRDRKIAAARIFWPNPLIPRDALDQDMRRGAVRDWVQAEPVLRYLRKTPQP